RCWRGSGSGQLGDPRQQRARDGNAGRLRLEPAGVRPLARRVDAGNSWLRWRRPHVANHAIDLTPELAGIAEPRWVDRQQEVPQADGARIVLGPALELDAK